MAKKNDAVPRAETNAAGGVIGLTPRGLEGWAWDPARPTVPVAIEVMVGGQLLGSFLANRADVLAPADSGVPAGHGFVAQLDVPPASVPLPTGVEIRVAHSGESIGSVQLATPSQLGWLLRAYVVGHLDAIQSGRLLGWAVDVKKPGEPLKVELLVSGERSGEGGCGIFRPDVKRSGIGDGMCGFALDLPHTLLDGRVHELKVRVGTTGIELGPMMFGPAAVSDLTQQVAQMQAKLAAMEKQVALLTAPGGKLYKQLEDALLQRHEALMEVHREGVEGELAHLRRRAGDSAAEPGAAARTARPKAR